MWYKYLGQVTDFYVQMEIQGIRMLDFGKTEEVFLQAAQVIA